MYIDNISIVKSMAGSTYGKWEGGSVEVKRGAKKTRLNFSSGEGGDIPDQTAASVYVEKIGKNYLKSLFLATLNHKFVKCTYNNETIYINITSLSKRLGISPEQILSHAKAGTLASLIEQSHKSYLQVQNKIEKHFKETIQKNYIEKGNKIETVDGKEISKADLYNMLGIAAFLGFKGKEDKTEIGYSLRNGKVLHLRRQEGEEWPLLTLFTNNVLGGGSFGTVQVVAELSLGRVSVAKIAQNNLDLPILNRKRIRKMKMRF